MKAIFQRRSTRAFKKKEITDVEINYLLSAAMSAPNSGNQRCWQFIVLRSESIRTEMNACHGYGNLLSDVDAAIVVCINKDKVKWDYRWQIDTGAAVENMIIAATDLGLATLWLELYPVEDKVKKAREILDLPASVVPMMILPLGDPKEPGTLREPRFFKELVRVL